MLSARVTFRTVRKRRATCQSLCPPQAESGDRVRRQNTAWTKAGGTEAVDKDTENRQRLKQTEF